jgi:DNA-binding MarR family transcriptional regulator
MGGSTKAAAGLPLSTLLSHALVAFTIELDNEFERLMPHRTTRHGSGEGPWLVSMAMWFNCMQFVGENGLTVRELATRARTMTNLRGMRRWGYITVAPDPADSRPKPPPADWVIRAKAKGRAAQRIWRPLPGAIEERWRERFGAGEIDRLREALAAVECQIPEELPDCLPILGYGLHSGVSAGKPRAEIASGAPSIPLVVLLARVLLAFAIEFERESDLSLATCANLLRVLDEKGVRLRDLPVLTGVSKEAIHMAMGIPGKSGLVLVEPEQAGSRVKAVRLTAKGAEAKSGYVRLLGEIERRWQARFGSGMVRNLREPLQRLVGDASAQGSPLFRGLEPYPDGWRASVPRPKTLPHYPMVLHRGGFPDGS